MSRRFGNPIKRLSKKQKRYIIDTDLCCYLQNISSSEALWSRAFHETYANSPICEKGIAPSRKQLTLSFSSIRITVLP